MEVSNFVSFEDIRSYVTAVLKGLMDRCAPTVCWDVCMTSEGVFRGDTVTKCYSQYTHRTSPVI